MNNQQEVFQYLSLRLRSIFGAMDTKIVLREIRLRAGKPLMVYGDLGEMYIDERGKPTIMDNAAIVSIKDIRETLEYVSNYSLYAYEEEIKGGFITMPGGNRVGICGRAVCDREGLKTIRNISFVNIRMAHQIKGCSDKIMEQLYENEMFLHTLIVSPPCCGKTTLLRDIIRNVSDGFGAHVGQTVGLVDERSEIAACNLGIPQNDIGIRTDVMDGCPKAFGMSMLIRSMSPGVLAVDEIGSKDEVTAIKYAINCGTKILATIHGSSIEELLKKPEVKTLLEEEIFERIIILSGGKPGRIQGIYNGKGELL